MQKVGSDRTTFRLNDVRGFTDKDIEFIMKSVSEYASQQDAIRNYLISLEGDKRSTLEQLKTKYKSIADATPMDLKFKSETEFKYKIEYGRTLDNDTEYITDIAEYDSMYNNILSNM